MRNTCLKFSTALLSVFLGLSLSQASFNGQEDEQLKTSQLTQISQQGRGLKIIQDDRLPEECKIHVLQFFVKDLPGDQRLQARLLNKEFHRMVNDSLFPDKVALDLRAGQRLESYLKFQYINLKLPTSTFKLDFNATDNQIRAFLDLFSKPKTISFYPSDENHHFEVDGQLSDRLSQHTFNIKSRRSDSIEKIEFDHRNLDKRSHDFMQTSIFVHESYDKITKDQARRHLDKMISFIFKGLLIEKEFEHFSSSSVVYQCSIKFTVTQSCINKFVSRKTKGQVIDPANAMYNIGFEKGIITQDKDAYFAELSKRSLADF